MIKKLLSIIAFVALLAGSASAENRIDWVTGVQPPANWLLQENLDAYEAQGQLLWDLIGRNNTAGFFTNLAIQPNSGMYVQGAPAVANQYASLYAIGAVDSTPYFGSTLGAMPPNSLQMFHQGLQSAPSAPIGPLVSPTTAGQYTGNLIEAQVQQADQVIQSVKFVSSSNVASSGPSPRDRNDIIVYQAKLGTATTTAPPNTPIPTVDPGWVAVGQVVVPANVTALTPQMMTTYPSFNGLLSAGSGGVISLGPTGQAWASLTSTGLSTGVLASTSLTPGDCLTVNSQNQIISTAGACGLASGTLTNVNGTGNVVANVSAGVASISLVNSPTFGTAATAANINLGTDLDYALTRAGNAFGIATANGSANPTFRADGGLLAGSSTYGPLAAVVYGPVSSTIFNGSGAGLTQGTIPDTSLVTAPVTAITAGSNVATTGGTVPTVSVTNSPTFTGPVTAPQVNTNAITAGSNVVSIIGNGVATTGTGPYIATWYNANSQIVSLTSAGLLTLPAVNATTGTFGTSTTNGQGLFGAVAAASTVGIGAAFSSTYPTITNSSQGGMNLSVAATDAWGFRFFKAAPALTGLATLDESGNWTVAGNVFGQTGVFSAVQSLTLGTASTNGTVNVPGSGSLYFNYFSGTGGFNFCNGAQACPVNINPAGGITAVSMGLSGGLSAQSIVTGGITNNGSETIAGSLSVGGAMQVGPNNPTQGTNYIVHGQTGTYPYIAGDYSGFAHTEIGVVQMPGGVGTQAYKQFNEPYSTTEPVACGIGYNYAAPLPGSWTTASYSLRQFNGQYIGIYLYGEGAANLAYNCAG